MIRSYYYVYACAWAFELPSNSIKFPLIRFFQIFFFSLTIQTFVRSFYWDQGMMNGSFLSHLFQTYFPCNDKVLKYSNVSIVQNDGLFFTTFYIKRHHNKYCFDGLYVHILIVYIPYIFSQIHIKKGLQSFCVAS